MQNSESSYGHLSAIALGISTILTAGQAGAQDAADVAQTAGSVMEEVVVIGRFRSAAESLSAEKLDLSVSADFLGAEVIGRAGDPDIASALRRVPGLTLVDGKFIYVRGLGERYSSVLINGAAVPSPDLTRSVVPLDLLPTSIVDSIKIQKSPSPDATSAFGGGMINIRTINAPQDAVLTFDIGIGTNSINNAIGLTSNAGGTPLSPAIGDGMNRYRGDISIANILTSLRASDPQAPISQAQAIHQGFLDSINRDVGIRPKNLGSDAGAKIALGNAWDFGDNWTLGVLMNGTYNEKWRNADQLRESVGTPANFVNIDRTVYEERTVGSLQFGVDFGDDHAFEINSFVISSDEDQTSISRGFDQNNQFPDQKVSYETRLQERELTIKQVSGTHTFLDTPWLSDFLDKRGLENLEFEWIYSESEARTDIPNQTVFQASTLLDATTGQEISTQVLGTTSAGQFQFLELNDRQDSWGGTVNLPLELERMYLTLSGGWWGSKKTRDYFQTFLNLNSVGVQSSVLSGTPGNVLSSQNLSVPNGFNLSLGSQFGTESYLAAQTIDAGFLSFDMDFSQWRYMIGARQEIYRQTVLPIDLLDYSGTYITNLQNALLDPNQRLAVEEDDVFASTALTYMGNGLLGSGDFQIRLSYGQTVVRPDLREVANVIFIDPELDIRVQGNPGLRPSPIDNFEVRSEFYYASGDNLTISLFYKDMQAPIEQIRSAGSDDDVVLGFTNADSGEVYGLEFEGLKAMARGFFLSGNATLSDSNIAIDRSLSTVLTNAERRLTGHSKWVVNTTLGWDSPNALHSAYLNFNAFGERIFFAGTGGNDDAYEQPFNSLGLVYKYFPTDNLSLEFSLDNILDEEREFLQKNANGNSARILVQEVGTDASFGVRWAF